MYAEIRSGTAGETFLAGLAEGEPVRDRGRLGEAAWKTIAASDDFRFLPVDGSLRAVARSFWLPEEHERVSIVVGGPTALLEESLASFRLFLIELAAGGLLLALAGGYVLAARTLHPIAALTAQVGRMAALPPSAGPHRVAVVNADDELGGLARIFNVLLGKIDAAAEQTRTFLADAAHEMKTPVAIVRMEAELSLAQGRSREELRQALSAIAGESERLSQLVRDLTLLAEGQVLEHPLRRSLLDLTELARDVIHAFRLRAAEKRLQVSLEPSESAEYRGDDRLLRQVLTNLVENAIKFSPAGSAVNVRVGRIPGGLELEVRDEADTLSADERQRVFERFYRAPSARSAGAAGSGLGLAIVEWAVRLHGGSVHVEPRSPAGNRFVVRLPVRSDADEGLPGAGDRVPYASRGRSSVG